MRFTTYSKYTGGLLDAIDLQELLDHLADFLLRSGFAGSPGQQAWWQDPEHEPNPHSIEALKEAMLRALLELGQLTPEMLRALRGQGEEAESARQELARLLDQLVERLVEEGYLNLKPGARRARPAPTWRPARGTSSRGRPRRARSTSSSPARGWTSWATARCATCSRRWGSPASAATRRRTWLPGSRPRRLRGRTSSATR